MVKSRRKPPAQPGGMILLVEDDVDLAMVTTAHLRDAGFGVTAVRNGIEALKVLRGGAPMDAVFSDVMLTAGPNGFDLARTIGKEFPDLPVLLTSGFEAAKKIAEIREFETEPKPYDGAKVAARLKQLIAKGRAAAR